MVMVVLLTYIRSDQGSGYGSISSTAKTCLGGGMRCPIASSLQLYICVLLQMLKGEFKHVVKVI